MVRTAHLKSTTWRRYGAAEKAFGAFVAEAYPSHSHLLRPPFQAAVVAEWVGDMVARGVRSASVAVAGINKVHVNAGGQPLRDSVVVQQALEGWERSKPAPEPKNPLTRDMLTALLPTMDTTRLRDARDFAMLVVARAGGFRGPSELLQAQLPLDEVAEGALVYVHTKSDRAKAARTAKRIPAAGPVGLAPLAVLRHYLTLSGHKTGFVFRSIQGGPTAARSSPRPVSRCTLNELVKRCAARLGCDPALFATHSLKHGCAADLKVAGVPTVVAMQVTGHATKRVYDGYGGKMAAQRALAMSRREAAQARAATESAAAALQADAWAASAGSQVPPF